jgi:hypothetical protein
MKNLLLASLFLTLACSSIENRNPTGEAFPQVTGRSLEDNVVSLPGDVAGAPAILLVGYVQETQFDLDRWILGLLQAQTPGQLLEVPTIEGMAGLFSDSIDSGMRSGIPSEDWGSVVTLYDEDAARVVRFTGDQRPRNGRVILLDSTGNVIWFHDRGYSARHLLELDSTVRSLLPVEETP